MGDQAYVSSFQKDLGIPINFQEESTIVSFRSLELHENLEVSRDVRPPVKMRRGTRVSSSISTQDADIPSSCEMQHEPEFKTLQGNPYFFESGSLVVHSTLDRKHRVPFTYLLMRENST